MKMVAFLVHGFLDDNLIHHMNLGTLLFSFSILSQTLAPTTTSSTGAVEPEAGIQW